ncbi:MAG: hypothetical protein ACKVUS_11580 [Saprospiraceae bacterium]
MNHHEVKRLSPKRTTSNSPTTMRSSHCTGRNTQAIAFRVEERGFLDEGCWADMVLVDVDEEWAVQPDNLFYKCGWSPFSGKTFRGKVQSTLVSGHLAWHEGRFREEKMGERLAFF